jgi:2-dehydro-3-deoxygalactonokinase
MRFIAVDWGTTRFRASLVEDGRVLERAECDKGVSALAKGEHERVFRAQCGQWLAQSPALPVLMVGMVGSREGWLEAPYARCPAGASEIAAALATLPLEDGTVLRIVPGLRYDAPDGHVDVLRGEETHILGGGVEDGLVCLPGTHCKWAELRGGRVERFATFITGELYALMRHHSMIGRPATEPEDKSGFALGLEAARRDDGRSLLTRLFGARAATVTRQLAPDALGPYLSGLLTGTEIEGALALFGRPDHVTIVADAPRADLYVTALGDLGIATTVVGQEATLLGGLARILAAHRVP